jgi:hypothetical protein
MQVIYQRLRHIGVVLIHPIWAWVIIGPLSLISLLAWLRDEFLSPSWQEKLKILNILPDWDWRTWAIAAAGVLIAAMLEGSYQAFRKVEIERSQFYDDLQAISLDRPLAYVNSHFNFQMDNYNNRTAYITSWNIILENLSDRMIKFDIVDSFIQHGDDRPDNLAPVSNGAFIHARQQMQHATVPERPIFIGNIPSAFVIGFSIKYDNVPPIRQRITSREIEFNVNSLMPVSISNVIISQSED